MRRSKKMCTAISFNGFFGRTLDYECGFGEEAVVIPRGFVFGFRHRESVIGSYAVAGMARMENGYPLFFDGMNEKGVAAAGLNFVGNARYSKAERGDVASFELIPYILSQSDSVNTALASLEGVRIADTGFSDNLPPSSLHWIVADKDTSAVIESTADGLHIYRDTAGVLTNDPPFPYQMMNLNNYLNITAMPAENRFSDGLSLTPYSRGMGAIGLPGDWSSPSRFVRASFIRENAVKEKSPAHFFRLMESVAVPKGCMMLDSGEAEYTRYVSCMDLENGIYYYNVYGGMSTESVKLL